MTWLSRLMRRRQMERQLDKELSFHIDQHAADLIAAGHDPAEARRQARLALGGVEQVKETCRDARGTRWLEDLQQDFRYALRSLRHRPLFTAVVVCTLALGGGATTLMFTVINSVLLRPLPYLEPDRLVAVREETDYSTQYGNQWAFAYPNYLDCKRDVRTLTLGAWRSRRGTVIAGGQAEYVGGRQISAELFSVLGASLVHGRTFALAEDQAGGVPVAIISHGLWQRQYEGSALALTKPLLFDGRPYTVVGVTAPGFAFSATSDVFTPLGQEPDPRLRNREAHPGIQVWARLNPGATLDEARTELSLIGRRLAQQYPNSNHELRGDAGDQVLYEVRTLDQLANGTMARQRFLLLLFSVFAGLALVLAFIGVYGVLAYLTNQRVPEFGIRLALGATAGNVTRLVLGQGLGLVGIGVAVGSLAALVAGRLLDRLVDGVHATELSTLVLAISVLVGAGFLASFVPARRASRVDATTALRQE